MRHSYKEKKKARKAYYKEDDGMDEYRERMKKSRLAFSEVKPTSEYSETNYFG